MAPVNEDKFVLLQPQGRLDSQGSISLRHQFSRIEPEQHNLWIVDMAEVDFIDSAGLLALITGMNIANRNQCRLVLCNPRPAVKLILEITQLDQVFEMIDSHTEIEAFTPSASNLFPPPGSEQAAA
ncbi:STAS domain-containing protein [Kovacikia minuta CCNUW1]|uniref:STAS domain-containing protein n=1 Tax=Kovacikia minuta TaxID=2931930 RepID=UPI001CC9E36C|nr:STAS domain-containing protein [Kovacikia minuta]UBF24554.1 STAS domain-containing protein [Kovacikia minuta CCNUW1]